MTLSQPRRCCVLPTHRLKLELSSRALVDPTLHVDILRDLLRSAHPLSRRDERARRVRDEQLRLRARADHVCASAAPSPALVPRSTEKRAQSGAEPAARPAAAATHALAPEEPLTDVGGERLHHHLLEHVAERLQGSLRAFLDPAVERILEPLGEDVLHVPIRLLEELVLLS